MAIISTTKKPLSLSLPLVAFITIYLTLLFHNAHSADTISFSFQNFNTDQKHLILQGDATITSKSNAVQLTRVDSNGNPQSGSVGRVLYSAPIRFWADSAVSLSFETTFTFTISRPGNTAPGDGLAFFISKPDIPLGFTGGLLGLFRSFNAINNSRNEIIGLKASSEQIVAVEFDTYVNHWDPTYKHIGIDVNSIRSEVTNEWDWQNGGVATAHISYNSVSGRLSAVTYYPNSSPASVAYDVNLGTVLPEWVWVGFSASTGQDSQINNVLSWSFSSSLRRKGDAAEADGDGYIASVV